MKLNFKDLTNAEKEDEKRKFARLIGERVKTHRLKKGLTQEELSDKAGYYRTYVGHVESAKHSPSVHTVWRFAKALDIELSELLKDL